jgi:DNA helicase HerA-like ATPase
MSEYVQKPVGLTKGPGETVHEFIFISPDKDQELKVGEFIFYQVEIGDQKRDIISRVSQRQPIRLLPNSFLSNPDVDPEEVAVLVGYQGNNHDLFEITATIIGYYDKGIGDFINPRLPPRSGNPIFLVEDEVLAQLLTKQERNQVGCAFIGSLLSRDVDKVPITIDVGAIASTHLAIIANTGAGKSYLAAVLIEEMVKPYNKAAVLIVDPHGEYDTLAEVRNDEVFVEPGYRPDVKVFRPGDVKVRTAALTMGDLFYLLPNLSDRMEYLLQRALRDVKNESRRDKGDPDRWTLAELKIRLRQIGEGSDSEEGEGDDRYKGTAEALIWRLESVLSHSTIFDDLRHLNVNELFRPGQCSVLQINEVDEKEQQVMVATLLRRLFLARVQTTKKQVGEGDELYLPYPVFVLIEEAHRFAPAGGDVVSSRFLKTVLSEGRKFGLGVGLISQRPGRLDGDVLSQCNTQFIMRIVNPIDQARVAESIENVGRDLLKELPALTKGQAVIAGEGVNTPVLCRVRPRYTRHGGQTMNAPVEWTNYFDPDEQARRERNSALPFPEENEDMSSKLF